MTPNPLDIFHQTIYKLKYQCPALNQFRTKTWSSACAQNGITKPGTLSTRQPGGGIWRNRGTQLLLELEAEKHADESEMEYDDDAIDAAAEAFRYDRDLITAEETEQWLSTRSLTLDDFGDYFTRKYWGAQLADEITAPEKSYVDAPADVRHLFAAELILSGDIDELTTQLVWRLAAAREQPAPDSAAMSAAESEFFERHGIDSSELPNWLASLGRDTNWFVEMQTMEAASKQVRGAALLPSAYKNELSALRLPLTRFETEVIELESRDAAKEALFCVTEDGMSMEEVAAEGRYPFKRIDFLLEDLPRTFNKSLPVSRPAK